ncbi:hypothetical protein RBB50_007729 [Rhinocladiella similis]
MTGQTLQLDPEFVVAFQAMAGRSTPPPIGDITTRRGNVNAGLPQLVHQFISPEHIEVERIDIPGPARPLRIQRFYCRSDDTNLSPAGNPTILHFHGGGYITMNVDMWAPYLKDQVARTSIQIFSVDYQLAPEAIFPAALEEAYSALLWLHKHAKQYNIDPARIAVQGESAGGGLAAALALLSRDRSLFPPLSKQILIYPMIDDRNLLPNNLVEPLATWRTADNITAWTAYLGQKPGSPGVPYLAAPARALDLTGLPPTYLDVGGLDIFRDEILAYASRLAAANIAVEFHLYPGVPHGFELIAPTTTVARRAVDNRFRAQMTL